MASATGPAGQTQTGDSPTRTVVLHYHLFKNAGTSVDQMLKAYFGPAWVAAEFPMTGNDNTDAVQSWIAERADARAFSSHTMVGPVPRPAGVEVVPVILLRDPIRRIASAYRFERGQSAETWGAKLAKAHDFDGYVRARLAIPEDRQCRNFQVSRLASLCPGEDDELARAKTGLEALHTSGVVGLVEDFAGFAAALTDRLAPIFEGFGPEAAHANTTTAAGGAPVDLDGPLAAVLEESNREDAALLAHAVTLLRASGRR